MNPPKVSHFIGFQPLGSGQVRFRTAGCGSCAWHRDLVGEDAVAALRGYAAMLRSEAEEALGLAQRLESMLLRGR
jgi:hypothetical protein